MDLSDRASAQEELANELMIKNRVKITKWDFEERECLDCGEWIPVARLEAVNAVLCIQCKTNEDKEL